MKEFGVSARISCARRMARASSSRGEHQRGAKGLRIRRRSMVIVSGMVRIAGSPTAQTKAAVPVFPLVG